MVTIGSFKNKHSFHEYMCRTLTVETTQEQAEEVQETIDTIISQHLKQTDVVQFDKNNVQVIHYVIHYIRGLFNCRHASMSIQRQGGQVRISISTDGFETKSYFNNSPAEETGIYKKLRDAVTKIPQIKIDNPAYTTTPAEVL